MKLPGTASLLLVLSLCVIPATGFAQTMDGQSGAGAQAASGTEGTGGASVEQLKKLRGTIGDDQSRQELLNQIDALIAVRESQAGEDTDKEEAGKGLLARASGRIDAVSEQITGLAASLAKFPALASEVWQRAQNPVEFMGWIIEAARLFGLLAAALAAGWVAGMLMARGKASLLVAARNSWVFSIFAYVLYLILALIPTAVFAAVGYAAMPVADMAGETRTLALILVNSLALVHAISVTAREVFEPPMELPTPFRLSEESGAYVAIWIRRFAVAGVYGYFIADALGAFGLPAASVGVLERVVGLLVAGMAIVFVMQSRDPVAKALYSDAAPRSIRSKLARTWHYLALLAIVLVAAVGMLGTADSFSEVARGLVVSILVIFVAAMLSQGVERLLGRVFSFSQELKNLHPRLEERANRYLPVLRKALKGIVGFVAVLSLLQVWGLGGIEWLTTETGRSIGARVLAIGLSLVAALIVWEVITTVVEDALNRASPDIDAAAMQRRKTLLPLAKNAIRLTLIVLVALIVFSELGMNIAPLLAGAGVIGLAIGFGAQTLVQDLITGVFILLEDSVAVGDFVEVAGYAGTVESLSIRSMRLRDLEGNVHTVPFSQVSTVHNMTDKYAYALLDVGVAYRENVDDVIAVLKELGDELQADETWGRDILDGMEVFGLNSLSDSAVEIRVRFKTVAGRQWAVRREFLRRIKATFDERDIEIPYPHRTLYFGMDKQGEAPPARVLVDSEQPEADESLDADTDSRRRPPSADGEMGGAQ